MLSVLLVFSFLNIDHVHGLRQRRGRGGARRSSSSSPPPSQDEVQPGRGRQLEKETESPTEKLGVRAPLRCSPSLAIPRR
ncbi:MAG: hypothetical protein ACLTSX_13815 [Collinsella sp.]